ncbi:MAG: LysR substrate-binding domain-containing protein, partial [Vicinamibacterales bacterium]
VAHSDPSPARERVLRVSEVRHAPINIQIALPSLEAIKRAVELQMGVALLPRRCALTEIARGTLVAVRVPEVRLPRQVRLVYRRRGELSHAATAFLEMVRQISGQADKVEPVTERLSQTERRRIEPSATL